ncbi:MAG: hypothetical protein HOP12_09765 [Candidatus Eisenbacteria bacterium]|uniref:Uncharacterized protein n=1 Tax=Eiseniibacteriota bacterium TaxID=2212470 RepID=A0A849SL38_UNCEI|nr:hypothetical protein [Candidatus Eisenbacteria bacterium]
MIAATRPHVLAAIALMVIVAITSLYAQSAADRRVPSIGSTSSPSLGLLAERARAIAKGRILSVSDINEEIGGKTYPFTVATIAVEASIKGSLPSTIEVRDLGSQAATKSGLTFSDAVTFVPNSEVIVFLEELGPAHHRYLSPLALRRGMFTVVSDAAGSGFPLDGDELATWQFNGVIPETARVRGTTASFWSAIQTLQGK